jgi:hypothetical protein
MARKRVIRVQVLYSSRVQPTIAIKHSGQEWATIRPRITPASMRRLVQAIRKADGITMPMDYGWTWER